MTAPIFPPIRCPSVKSVVSRGLRFASARCRCADSCAASRHLFENNQQQGRFRQKSVGWVAAGSCAWNVCWETFNGKCHRVCHLIGRGSKSLSRQNVISEESIPLSDYSNILIPELNYISGIEYLSKLDIDSKLWSMYRLSDIVENNYTRHDYF